MTDQANGPASDAMTIARLAALTSGDYDRVRRKEADQLGWRVETLDAEVAKARRVATSCSEVDDRPPEFTDEALALRFTEVHKEILRYVAAGYTNGQISRRLDVSEATVRKHLENIFCRLGVSNRTATAAQLDPPL